MKRPFEMVELFKKISAEKKNALLLIAGRGELFDAFSHYIKNENLKNVKILGFVPDSNLPDIYACSDYYWSTSKYEGQPLTLLEAMASGLPCIVPDIPSFEVVNEADCGIMIEYPNQDSALESIQEFLHLDYHLYRNNARLFAEKHLDWQIIAKQYLELFKRSQVYK
jgi:glycosyltransferase involved in cell wall biosynthesis